MTRIWEEDKKLCNRFAAALKAAAESKGVRPTSTGISRAVGCGLYAAGTWLKGWNRPGRRYGPKVLEVFGVDSREYGGDWNKGKK